MTIGAPVSTRSLRPVRSATRNGTPYSVWRDRVDNVIVTATDADGTERVAAFVPYWRARALDIL